MGELALAFAAVGLLCLGGALFSRLGSPRRTAALTVYTLAFLVAFVIQVAREDTSTVVSIAAVLHGLNFCAGVFMLVQQWGAVE